LIDTAEDDVSKLLKDSGVTVEADSLKLVLKKIADSGKPLHELIAEGKSEMATVGGSGAGPAAAVTGGDAPAEEKVEEKKKEEEPEEDVDMGGLFGDDDDY
jgi:large subunit ribosomal protein LP1